MIRTQRRVLRWLGLLWAALLLASFASTLNAESGPPQSANDPFARENVIAWCVVPFDAKKRTPEERVDMLNKLGLRHFAYDWRAEHLPSFDREVQLLKKRGICLDAVWFPAQLNDDAKKILEVLRKHHIQTQLWITMDDPAPTLKEQTAKVGAAVKILKPIAEEAAKLNCRVALYNHGGWFGEPENQLPILEALKMANAGIVYNLHHGHEHLDRLPTLLKKMVPHLYALNLNGMVRRGDQTGQKILPIGMGDQDLAVLRAIRASGFQGPYGVLGHTQDDVELRLLDNLDGLDWLSAQLYGKPAKSRPRYRTQTLPPAPGPSALKGPSYLAAGKPDYGELPLTIECRVKLKNKDRFNIIVAKDTKASAAHWEIFSQAGSGFLTVYVPGMKPDHVRSKAFVCDDQWHTIALHLEPVRIRLYLDGLLAADQSVTKMAGPGRLGDLAIGRLVEGDLDCDGIIDFVHIRKGVCKPSLESLQADGDTIGLWIFGKNPTLDKEVKDASSMKNPAKLTVVRPVSEEVAPPDGPNYVPTDSRLKAVLIDRSAEDTYLAVKLDTEGRLFVGAREALYVFEPEPAGGYGLRQELYRFPPDSLIIGLEWRGNDLYALTNNALYVLPEGRIKRDGVKPQRLVWGLPLDLHVSFHCLAWGPEGDLYLNHGDPLLNYGDFDRPDHWGHWTLYYKPPAGSGSSEWAKLPFSGAGAVLRIHPDGTGLQVVARGLRGPVGLAFDENWNLFTNDNDHESRPDLYVPARLLHVTPHADFGWPRGWMASKSLDRADLLEPMISTLGRGVPCDMAYYGESLFPKEFRHSLLMDRWDRMAVNYYPLTANGSTFRTQELPFVEGRNNARPTGIAVGRNGCIFVTALYLAGNVWSPHCVSDLFMIAPEANSTAFAPFDPVRASADRLWSELTHESWERRYRAHQEILRRGGIFSPEALKRLESARPGDPALNHLPWLAAKSGDARIMDRLAEITKDATPNSRLQLIRALAEFGRSENLRPVLATELMDDNPQIALAALKFFFDDSSPLPMQPIIRLATASDTYLRQTACKLLARRAGLADMTRLARAKSPLERLAGTLAIGFRITEPSEEQLPDKLPLEYASGNASFSLRFADESRPVDIRSLGRVGSFTTALWWQTITRTADQEAQFNLLLELLKDKSDAVALQAAYSLSLLRDARSESLIGETRQRIQERALAGKPVSFPMKVWMAGPFAGADSKGAIPPAPELGPIDLTAKYKNGMNSLPWATLSGTEGNFSWKSPANAAKTNAHYLYWVLQSGIRQKALLSIAHGSPVKVWHNGKAVGERGKSEDGPFVVLCDVQPGSNEILVRIQNDGEAARLKIHFQAKSHIDAVLPEKVQPLSIGSGPESLDKAFLEKNWTEEVKKGNSDQGRRLFGRLNCVRCHAVTVDQVANGAPSLTDARKRFTVPYLVESILLPSRQVAEEFRSTTVILKNGQSINGLITSENDADLEILLPDATRRTLHKKDIEERIRQKTSPMPSGLVKTPEELRDLLAYLLSDNPLPP